MFADRLLSAIDEKGAPICVGLDPIIEMIPDSVLERFRRNGKYDAEASVDAIFEFTTRVLKVVAQPVPIVKFQSAYFEQFMSEGVEAYYSLVQEASELGLLLDSASDVDVHALIRAACELLDLCRSTQIAFLKKADPVDPIPRPIGPVDRDP